MINVRVKAEDGLLWWSPGEGMVATSEQTAVMCCICSRTWNQDVWMRRVRGEAKRSQNKIWAGRLACREQPYLADW